MSAAEEMTPLQWASVDIARRDKRIEELEKRLLDAHERIGWLTAELERERRKGR